VDDLYDELTSRRIDGQPVRKGRRTVGTGRRAVGGAALLTGVALGLQEVFEPREAAPIIEEISPDRGEPEAVSLYLVRGFPARSRALVRPWLLA
jgi:hypothetical protein